MEYLLCSTQEALVEILVKIMENLHDAPSTHLMLS